MFKNYLKTAFKNLVKNRFYTSINIIGLATGLSVAILILLWVENEIGYDRFHNNANNIYRVLSNMGSGSSRQIWEKSHAPLAIFAEKTIPEIKNAVRIKDNDDLSMFSSQDKIFTEKKLAYVDPSFFNMFDFKLVKGNMKMPFVSDQSVILTQSTAERYFGDEDPINKVLESENKQQFVVSGIVEDFPGNSSLQYDMLFPMNHFEKIYQINNEGKTIDQDWGNFSYTTFLQLPGETSIETVQEKLAIMLRSNYKDIGIKDPYALQLLVHMHLYKTDGSEGRMQIVRIFLIIGILILVIACINYVNLSTARAILRAKEVSVRKMIGAEKFQLFTQFFIETAVIFFFATIAALVLTQLMMPVYNKIAGENIALRLTDTNVWSLIVITVMSTLVLSSVYPAWLLSSFEPLKVLKGRVGPGLRAASFRKVLVTIQFVFSVALIAGTLVIDGQLKYIHQKELGYDKQNVFSLGLRDMQPHALSVKNEIAKIRGVHGISFASDNLVNIGITTSKTDWDGKDQEKRFFVHPLTVDKDFIPVFKLTLTKGTGFTGIASDTANFILNETAVREAGIIDPIGKRFSLWGKQGIIIGVVQDFHFKSLKEKIEPSVFSYSPENSQIFVKTSGKDASQVIEAVGKLWKQYNGSYPFEFSFLDDDYDNLYKSEQRTGMLFALFSIVAVVISCLGLFGLATYTAQVKIKEIGIRKVLGASVGSIIQILAKDFIRLVLIAIVIATPMSWYTMNYWIQDYTYRIDVEWWMFALAGLITIVITLITVSFQSVRAAMMNPVKSLRTE